MTETSTGLEQMQVYPGLAKAIEMHAKPQAQAGDWSGVAEIIRAVKTTGDPRKCRSFESAFAVLNVGGNPDQMLEELRKDATGNLLYLRLADASDSGGVVWAEPILTIPYLRSRVNDGLSNNVVEALISLSMSTVFTFANVTASDCESAYMKNADVLLSLNITNGSVSCSLQVSRDGTPVLRQSITQSIGTPADQKLLSAIQAAIDSYLTEG